MQFHDATRFENDQQHYTVHRQLCMKVGHTVKLKERLEERIAFVEESLQATNASLQELEAANAAKQKPIEVNRWRVSKRTERPKRENIQDSLEAALEEEKETLADAQKKLQRQAVKTRQMIQKLETTRDELKDDLKNKGEAFRIDANCIKQGSSWGGSLAPTNRTSPEPFETATEKSSCSLMTSGYTNRFEESEHKRQYDTLMRDRRAKKREEEARSLRGTNAEIISQLETRCTSARKHTEARLCERIEETTEMRRRIMGAVEVTNAKIHKLTSCLNQTGEEIAAFEQPLDIAHTRQKLRAERPTKERIGDEVSDAIATQLRSLHLNKTALQKRHKEEQDSLRRLQEAKTQLLADLDDKQTALNLDKSLLCKAPPSTPRPPPKPPLTPRAAPSALARSSATMPTRTPRQTRKAPMPTGTPRAPSACAGGMPMMAR